MSASLPDAARRSASGTCTPRPPVGAEPLSDSLSLRHRGLIEEALEIDQDDARKINATGYLARILAQATLPHTDPKLAPGTLYSRSTGRLTLTIAPTSRRHGIPYGSIPRVILAWICTEATRTKSRTLDLGHSQAEFLARLGLHNNGRDIARLREQSLRLFKSVIGLEYDDDAQGDHSARLLISERSHVFWHPAKADERASWESSLDLSQGFFDEILASPVPLDLDVFHALARSPLAMDIYTWLTYRMFVLRRSGRPFALVPWAGLKAQLGANYGDDRQGLYAFKAKFRLRLREVLAFYPEARSHVEDDGRSGCLKLTPCELHITPRKARPPTA